MKSSLNFNKNFLRGKRILVTGGAGFIGSTLIREIITTFECKVFNMDKIGYSSDLTSFEQIKLDTELFKKRYKLLKYDLNDFTETLEVIKIANPDFIFHLAAESHVDRSIQGPRDFMLSNIMGTFNLLEASLSHFNNLEKERKKSFRFLHISTDEVFGSLGREGVFNEDSKYDPRSPYSASKASSDHLVRAWHHTYGFPVLITNCSNNFGPWQFPEKLIPLVINKAINGQEIPIYGDGQNIRDWLFVEDHVDALLTVISKGDIGETYCIGSNNEKTNLEIVELICAIIDRILTSKVPTNKLIKFVKDRPGHDRRYAIDSLKLKNKLGWKPSHDFRESLEKTVIWYLNNNNWCLNVMKKSRYRGERLGNIKTK
tara:strand:+ start:13 stop:1128 length:1116 start_codon:yes stop_codon:yes gene_type:complete